ncbi:MAG TPA: NAD(P)H-binding protein [Streptosporangiales bacterium]
MRIAVVGATGQIGTRTVAALERAGHDAVRISRSLGVDVYAGTGLAGALEGVDAVVDSSNTSSTDRAEVLDFFTTSTANLLDAERAAGVRHHVLLSIVGIDRGQRNFHYDGKRAQERLVTEGPVPWTILRATQFHDFAETAVGWTEQDGSATVAPLLIQPVAPADVADVLAELATGEPHLGRIELAGPQTEDLVDMARRALAARGRAVRLVPTWRGRFDVSMAGEVQLPGDGARIGPTSFDDWLADGMR